MSKANIKIVDVISSKISLKKLPSKCDIIRAICFEKETNKITNDAAIKLVSQQIHEV